MYYCCHLTCGFAARDFSRVRVRVITSDSEGPSGDPRSGCGSALRARRVRLRTPVGAPIGTAFGADGGCHTVRIFIYAHERRGRRITRGHAGHCISAGAEAGGARRPDRRPVPARYR